MTQANLGNRTTFLRNLTVFALALFIFGWAATDGARAADPNLWTVTGVSGKARVLTGRMAWTELGKGMVLRPGSRVETGSDGRISLVRPGDSLAVSPNSRFDIPAAGKTGTVAHLKQALGTLLFKITTRPENPFNVKTPYLTAVIKGTTFTVSVGQTRAALHVAEGAVQVTSALSGLTVMVNPGQTAISGRGGANLRVTGNTSRGGAKAAGKSAAASSKATSGSDDSGKAATGSEGSGEPADGSKASGTVPASSGAAITPFGKGHIILRSLGAGSINIFQVTKGLVNDGNRPDSGGNPNSKVRSNGNPSLAAIGGAGSFDSPKPGKSHGKKKKGVKGFKRVKGVKGVKTHELGGKKGFKGFKRGELGGKDDDKDDDKKDKKKGKGKKDD